MLDFCTKDDTKFMKLIQPRQRQKAGVAHGVSTRKMSTAKDMKEFRDKILHALSKTDWLAPKQLQTRLPAKPWRVREALAVLLKAGKVEKQGRVRSVKYRRK